MESLSASLSEMAICGEIIVFTSCFPPPYLATSASTQMIIDCGATRQELLDVWVGSTMAAIVAGKVRKAREKEKDAKEDAGADKGAQLVGYKLRTN